MQTEKLKLEYYYDKETFLKLKKINKHLTKAKKMYRSWHRAKIKTVNKKTIPDLKDYKTFIEEWPRGNYKYFTDRRLKERSKKSSWCETVQDSKIYYYYDPQIWYFFTLNSKAKNKGIEFLNDIEKEELKDTWYYLNTYHIDESYTICRRPISEKNNIPPKISKEKIEKIYEELKSLLT